MPNNGLNNFEYVIYQADSTIYSITCTIHIGHMEINNLCHQIVKHKKTASIVNLSWFTMLVYDEKQRSQNLIHPLHITDIRIYF